MTTKRSALILRSFCLWTVFVWAVLVKNMLSDRVHSFGFRAVHIGLALISLTFAAAVWPLARRLSDRSLR